jgi:hypothetical protein
MRQLLFLALAMGAVSSAGAQTVPVSSLDAGIAPEQADAEAPREGRARFRDPEDSTDSVFGDGFERLE